MHSATRLRITAAIRICLAISGLCVAGTASAFLINMPPLVTVVEFKNVDLNHYFLTADSREMAAIDAGAAGPGWFRTGYGFTAFAYKTGQCNAQCEPVSRFYGTPGLGPNSHFYTADAAEAAGLKVPGSGWSFERDEFAIYVPDRGSCVPGMTPVYRFYNNRWMFNDSNHRYVVNAAERLAMTAQGWINEGIKFCTTNVQEVPFAAYAVETTLDGKIRPSAECEDETRNLGSCIAVNNLPVPDSRFGPYGFYDVQALYQKTSVWSDFVYAPAAGPIGAIASNVFVQGGPYGFGIHVDSRSRGVSSYSSINPLYQFRTTTAPGAPDTRFFPWRSSYPFATQLSILTNLNVVRVQTRDANSHAYGHPTIEFIDQVSGQHLYFTVLAYGTITPTDFLAPDVVTGKVIVGTTYRAGSPYGRSVGNSTLFTPSGLDTIASGRPMGGVFDFRMERAEFQRVVDAARSVNPSLSPDPSDYLLDNFHFNNEVVGDGEIGLNLANFQLRVMRR